MKQKMVTEDAMVVEEYYSYTKDELINQIDLYLEKIPGEFRDSAKFSVEIDETWHQYQENPSRKAVLKCSFVRPENEEEMSKRKAEEDKYAAERELREKAEFARLSLKFGNSK